MHQFEAYIRGGYPLLWVVTLEPQRAQEDLFAIAQTVHENGSHRSWDIKRGMGFLQWEDVDGGPPRVEAGRHKALPPADAVSYGHDAPPLEAVTFLWNLHRFLSPPTIQALQNSIVHLKSAGHTLVVLAPSAEGIPPELSRDFTIMDFDLPDPESLTALATRMSDAVGAESQGEDRYQALSEAARGLTMSEAEDAFALALLESRSPRRMDPDVVAREKANALLRHTNLQTGHYEETFETVAGLNRLKAYALATFNSPLSRGIMIVGPPGVGKSAFAKALGREAGCPTLTLDFGRMMASLVGESEGRIRAALQSVDAMGRVVLFIDEIEKGLAGVKSSGQSDSGVKASVGATFLKWMSDREPGGAYVVATSNDIRALPPEYQRAERWDSIWHIDMPNDQERKAIWKIYTRRYNTETDASGVRDEGWTGAEIHACARHAAMMGSTLREAADYVVPISQSMADHITAITEWADGRALPASDAQVTRRRARKSRLN